MRALSCSHEVSTTSPYTAACEGQDFRRTIHAHFEGHSILHDLNAPQSSHVNVKMLSQDTAMIGDRTPTTGKRTLDFESDTLPYSPPWPRLFLD